MKTCLITAFALAGALTLPLVAAADDSTKYDGTTYKNDHESMGEYVDDATITTKIKADYAKDKVVSMMKVKVDTDRGVVTLAGTAKSQSEVDQAVAIAKATKGVTSVRNDIVISPK